MKKPYSQETWIVIRSLFETGTFSTLNKLHKHCQNIIKNCPSIYSIRVKSSREGWTKGKTSDIIKKEIDKKTIDLFSELGMPKEKVLTRVVDMINSGENSIDRIVDLVTKRVKKGETPIDGNVIDGLKSMVSSYAVQYKGIRLWIEMTGESAPKKIDHSGRVTNDVRMDYPLKDLSDDELDAKIKESLERQDIK